jgi:hypothetical protein
LASGVRAGAVEAIAGIVFEWRLRCDLTRDAAQVSSPLEIVTRDLIEVATLPLGHIVEENANAALSGTDVGAVVDQLDRPALFGESKNKR